MAGPYDRNLLRCYRGGIFLTAANRGLSGFSVRQSGWMK